MSTQDSHFDPDQTRSADGTFSAEAADATAAAHKATAEAYTIHTAESHERAAKLHRVAAMRHMERGDAEQAAIHEAIAKAHDAFVVKSYGVPPSGGTGRVNAELQTLDPSSRRSAAETDRPSTLVLGNASAIDDEGWGLIAPFGEHPKTRVFRENGRIKEQQFIQVLDNDAADAMTAKENSFFGKLKRAVIGIPVFKGHGDLRDADPQAVSNETEKIKLGVVDQIRKTARGIEAHFALDNDGVKAVTEEGYKYPSAFWWVLPNGRRGDAILAKPFKLISVALTPYPNISGVESLANTATAGQTCRSAPPIPIAEQELNGGAHRDAATTNEPDMKLIAGWLRARGVPLGNAEIPTEAQVLDSLETLFTSTAGEVAALGNENSTLSGQLSAITADRDAQKVRAEQNAAALGNEQSARKADRKLGASVIVDIAIRGGIKSVAERAAAIESLANSADFQKAADELLKNAPAHTTTRNGRDVSGKQMAALQNEHAAALLEYNELFSRELPLAGQNPVKAHDNVMAKYPALAERLRPQRT